MPLLGRLLGPPVRHRPHRDRNRGPGRDPSPPGLVRGFGRSRGVDKGLADRPPVRRVGQAPPAGLGAGRGGDDLAQSSSSPRSRSGTNRPSSTSRATAVCRRKLWRRRPGRCGSWSRPSRRREYSASEPGRSPARLRDAVAEVLKWLSVAALAAAALWWWFRARAIHDGRTDLADAAVSRDFIFTIVLLLVVTSRVLSPQFMLWLVGLAAVVLTAGTTRTGATRLDRARRGDSSRPPPSVRPNTPASATWRWWWRRSTPRSRWSGCCAARRRQSSSAEPPRAPGRLQRPSPPTPVSSQPR